MIINFQKKNKKVGFNYGIDLIVTHNNRSITLKRNTVNTNNSQSPYKGLLSNKITLRIYYAMKLVELDKHGNEVWTKETPITCLDLIKNDDKFLLQIEAGVKYPLIFNLYVTSHPFNFTYFNNNAPSNNTHNNAQSSSAALEDQPSALV
jgi:hypothetical protein